MFKRFKALWELFQFRFSKFMEGQHIKHQKRRLKNHNFTIICSNCIGGVIYHMTGEPFCSPTINAWMSQSDFLKCIGDLKGYMAEDLQFIETDEASPVAMLRDITIHFNHYKTPEEVQESWSRRLKRINYDNLFFVMYEMDGIGRAEIEAFGKIPCKGRLIITTNDYPDIPYAVTIPAVPGEHSQKRFRLNRHPWLGTRHFEKYFDYVAWLNKGN